MLSTLQPKTPQSVSILTSTGGPTVQYAPDHCAFAMPQAQTKAVLMPAQAQQDLAGQSTLTEQVMPFLPLLSCTDLICDA